jgi:DNA-binding CsgD family transcriptional regulator
VGIQELASRVCRAQDVRGLAACVLDDTGALAGAPMRGLYVFSQTGIDIHVRNVPDGSIELYERCGRAFDPVLAGVARSHAPCQISFAGMYEHSRTRSLPDAFRELVDAALSVAPDGQYMAAPVVVNGALAGHLNFSRTDPRPFDAEEIMTASAMALHVSTRLATLRALTIGLDEAWEEVLTRRGREVAELAARGLTTHEIGRALGVSANTAKKHLRIVYERLGVSTRAELAGTLTRGAAARSP